LKLYRYVGPAELAKRAESDTPRAHIDSAEALAAWIQRQAGVGTNRTLTVTFVILPDGLWIADRHSEHVACARGAPVHSAGELTIALGSRRTAEVVAVTNQSTGYCPEPESWPAVEAALDATGIPHPDGFEVALVFRRCTQCGTTNIVKDRWFVCAVCNGQLPKEWNFGGSS
jgi:hypothetical protein